MNTFVLILAFFAQNCSKATPPPEVPAGIPDEAAITVGAARLDAFLPLLQGKAVALVVNQTSMVGPSHLVDTLLTNGIDIRAIFSPEHGFRGEADAGEELRHDLR